MIFGIKVSKCIGLCGQISKSIVDMLIVDMRRCEKYKESHEKFISLNQALERSFRKKKGDLGELPACDTGIPSTSDCSQVIFA